MDELISALAIVVGVYAASMLPVLIHRFLSYVVRVEIAALNRRSKKETCELPSCILMERRRQYVKID